MTTKTSQVRLYFIRHAQSEANLVFATICGQNIPSTLSPLGNEQSVLLGKRLKYQKMKFDYLFSSTAIRAKQTADIVLNLMNIDTSKLITSNALLEQSQGSWEGMNRDSCYTAEIMQQMGETHIEFSAPNGESMRMVQKRAIEFLEPFIEQAKKQSIEENRVISLGIFTHANLIRTVLQYYLQSNPKHAWQIGQNNTAITEILFNQYGTSLVRVNDSGHLTFLIPEISEKS
jgi:broad specificity phosphatase PhoE